MWFSSIHGNFFSCVFTLSDITRCSSFLTIYVFILYLFLSFWDTCIIKVIVSFLRKHIVDSFLIFFLKICLLIVWCMVLVCLDLGLPFYILFWFLFSFFPFLTFFWVIWTLFTMPLHFFLLYFWLCSFVPFFFLSGCSRNYQKHLTFHRLQKISTLTLQVGCRNFITVWICIPFPPCTFHMYCI